MAEGPEPREALTRRTRASSDRQEKIAHPGKIARLEKTAHPGKIALPAPLARIALHERTDRLVRRARTSAKRVSSAVVVALVEADEAVGVVDAAGAAEEQGDPRQRAVTPK